MKVWHHGHLKTQEQMWADQTPYEVYRAASRRLDGGDADLRQRWPTLGDANRAMTEAWGAMTEDARGYETSMAEADLNLIGL